MRQLRMRLAPLALALFLWPATSLFAQATKAAPTATAPAEAKEETKKAPTNPIDAIKDEGLKRSQVMKTLSYLTDVIGPRLTASPNMKRANEWTRDTMAGWGLENAHLEAWGPFGRGWSLKQFSAQVVEPQCIPLIAFPKAWSPGTDGAVTGEVVYFDAKNEKDLETYKGKLKGAIVLNGAAREVKAWFEAPGKRLTEESLLNMANAPEPQPRNNMRAMFGGARRGTRGGTSGPNPFEFQRKKAQFLIDEGAAVIVDPSFRGDGGTLFVQQASVVGPSQPGGRRISPWDKEAPKTLPQVVMAIEHYNRLVRMIEQGEKLKVRVNLDVAFHDDDLMGYNTVAEIPGTDLKHEVVMLGGHMDSWHSGTGATDNGAGVSVAMEAARIIKAAGLKPRRTIRVALWSGEEQGLLGSRAYVKEHFGGFGDEDSETQAADLVASMFGDVPSERKLVTKPEYETFCGYFNLDNGTGKVRGVYMEGNEAVRPIFRRWLTPFRDLGAATLTPSPTFGTDHMSFDAIGLPGFQFIQDPVEYETRTHHSNQDLYDRVQADDLKQASVIMAAFVYNAATMDQKLPRKPLPGSSRTRSESAAR